MIEWAVDRICYFHKTMDPTPFIPPDLPPEVDLSEILALAVDTHDAVARYDESIKRLPEPAIIRRSFETKEAVLSSKIEGTQATLREVMEYDIRLALDSETDKAKDYEEIHNYRLAIDIGRQWLKKEERITVELIKELHRALLSSVRGQNNRPGEFRQRQVYIGQPGARIHEATYIAPPSEEVDQLMNKLMDYVQANHKGFSILIEAALIHYQFEAIHPFEDGNGRIGRLLISIYLCQKGVTDMPNLYISEFLERHRREYYEALNLVSSEGNWLHWIKFFLMAVRQQAVVSKERVGEIERLYNELRGNLSRFNSKYASNFLDALFKQPVFSPSRIASLAKIDNQQTAYNLIRKFADANLIGQVNVGSQRGGRLFIFIPLMEIIE